MFFIVFTFHPSPALHPFIVSKHKLTGLATTTLKIDISENFQNFHPGSAWSRRVTFKFSLNKVNLSKSSQPQ